MTAARATDARTADEALAYLRRLRARQVASGLGVALTDGTYLFGQPWPGDFPSVECQDTREERSS